MMRQEFIEQLRIALQGKIPQKELNEHLRYYDNYIMEEARKGQTEEQVIEKLGDPRLIAKTLSMTDTSGREKEAGYQRQGGKQRNGFRWNSWYGRAILIIIAILIVIVVGHVLAFLLPVVLTVALVLLVLSFFLGKRR